MSSVSPSSASPPTRFTTGAADRRVGDHVVRFDRAERWVHWVSAALILAAVVTGAILYIRPLAVAVGRRELVKNVHVVVGLSALVPTLVVMAGPWGTALLRDVRRVARWYDDDVAFFRRGGRSGVRGKFNGGQKLNAVLASSGLVVMAMTGTIMKWFSPFPLEWRTGATVVHDWVSFGMWLLIGGHLVAAFTQAGALRGMVTGWVAAADARRRPRWWSELTDAMDVSDASFPSGRPGATGDDTAADPSAGTDQGVASVPET